jgi:hypothetical protein
VNAASMACTPLYQCGCTSSSAKGRPSGVRQKQAGLLHLVEYRRRGYQWWSETVVLLALWPPVATTLRPPSSHSDRIVRRWPVESTKAARSASRNALELCITKSTTARVRRGLAGIEGSSLPGCGASHTIRTGEQDRGALRANRGRARITPSLTPSLTRSRHYGATHP